MLQLLRTQTIFNIDKLCFKSTFRSWLHDKIEAMWCAKRTPSIISGHCYGFSSSNLISVFFYFSVLSLYQSIYCRLYVKVICCSAPVSSWIPLIPSLQIRKCDCLSEFRNIHDYKEVHTKSKALMRNSSFLSV